jgi:hypothetical protein
MNHVSAISSTYDAHHYTALLLPDAKTAQKQTLTECSIIQDNVLQVYLRRQPTPPPAVPAAVTAA